MKSTSKIPMKSRNQSPGVPQLHAPKFFAVAAALVLALLVPLLVAVPAHAQNGASGCVLQGVQVETAASQQECGALLTLYLATDGPNWTDSTGWDTATDPCGWNGIRCTDQGITSLRLEANELTGEIPVQLAGLGNLEDLSFAINSLTGEIPAELATLSALQRLNFANNELTGEIPAELGDLSSLEYLLLPINSLSGSIPAELGDLSNLKSMRVWSNELTGEIPAELGSLTNLTDLNLDHNQLTGEIPAELGDLPNLESLSLKLNRLSGSIPDELGSLTNLESLSLSRNSLSGEIPAELGGLAGLTSLDLRWNQFTGDLTAMIDGTRGTLEYVWIADGFGGNDCLTTTSVAVAAFLDDKDPGWDACEQPPVSVCSEAARSSAASAQQCDALLSLYQATGGSNWATATGWNTATDPCDWFGVTCGGNGVVKLQLGSNRLRGSIPSGLSDLTHLTALDLQDNALSGSIPAELGGLSNLDSLRLQENELTGPIPSTLGDLSNLRSLRLQDNKLSGRIPAELGSLESLQVLNLRVNKLTGSIPGELGNLASLTSLILAGNLLSGPIPVELGALDNLTSLRLYDNALSGDLTAAISGTRDTLESVRLNGNDCLSSTSAAVAEFLDAADSGWDKCGQAPEFYFSNTCLAGNGRVDVNVVNHSDAPAVYTYQVGSLSPRTFTVAAGDWGRGSVTGRPNGPLPVTVWKDGQVVRSRTIEVVCSPEQSVVTTVETQVVVSCRAGNGFVTWLFANDSAQRRSYVITFTGVPNRSTSAAAFGGAVRGVSGRSDGVYRYSATSAGELLAQGTVTIDCD